MVNRPPPSFTAVRWSWAARGLSSVVILYSLGVVLWQHNHLSSQYVVIDSLLLKTKDAYFSGQSISSLMKIGNGTTNKTSYNIATTNGGTIHRPASLILQNPKLPDWVKQYAAWHNTQRTRFLDAKRNNSTSADDIKFLISRCLENDTCGGASDRLQDMPYNLMLANQTNRILLVRWEKPGRLQHYLVPPKDGIDWTLEGEMYNYLKHENWHNRGKETDTRLQIVSTIRRDSAAPIFRYYENTQLGHKIYHEVFRLLFTPSPALAERVESTMTLLGLVPTHYSSIHLRVKYPHKDIKEATFTFERHKSKIVAWATNAVNCAAELHPNTTIYVSSDSNDTVGYLLEESQFAKHYIEATTKHAKTHPLVVKLVSRDYSNENEHVAFSNVKDPDGFMSVFEDLIIMGLGKCVAHGLGGYGRLGAALSGGECVIAHLGRNSKICSDVLAKIQV